MVIYRNLKQIKDEIPVLKKSIAFYEYAVFVEHLERVLPMLNSQKLGTATNGVKISVNVL